MVENIEEFSYFMDKEVNMKYFIKVNLKLVQIVISLKNIKIIFKNLPKTLNELFEFDKRILNYYDEMLQNITNKKDSIMFSVEISQNIKIKFSTYV